MPACGSLIFSIVRQGGRSQSEKATWSPAAIAVLETRIDVTVASELPVRRMLSRWLAPPVRRRHRDLAGCCVIGQQVIGVFGIGTGCPRGIVCVASERYVDRSVVGSRTRRVQIDDVECQPFDRNGFGKLHSPVEIAPVLEPSGGGLQRDVAGLLNGQVKRVDLISPHSHGGNRSTGARLRMGDGGKGRCCRECRKHQRRPHQFLRKTAKRPQKQPQLNHQKQKVKMYSSKKARPNRQPGLFSLLSKPLWVKR